MANQFSVSVTGDEIPEESELLSRLKQALNRNTRRINIINGYVMDTDSSVRMSVGPVIGEVTTNKALLMIEVVGDTEIIPICAKLYKEWAKDKPIKSLDKKLPARRPAVFQFDDLEPSTEYTGMSIYDLFRAIHLVITFKNDY